MPIPLRSAEALSNVPDAIIDLSWSPDSSRVVVAGAGGPIWITGVDGRLLDTLTGHADGTFKAQWQPGGHLIASVGQDGQVRFWNPDGGPTPEPFAAGTD